MFSEISKSVAERKPKASSSPKSSKKQKRSTGISDEEKVNVASEVNSDGSAVVQSRHLSSHITYSETSASNQQFVDPALETEESASRELDAMYNQSLETSQDDVIASV